MMSTNSRELTQFISLTLMTLLGSGIFLNLMTNCSQMFTKEVAENSNNKWKKLYLMTHQNLSENLTKQAAIF